MTTMRLPGVYRPQDDTALLARALSRDACAAHVLDLCTGSGALALAAARAGAATVTAVDVSWRAAATTWMAGHHHRIPVTVRRGDLYEPVRGRRFDLITANPPYVPAATPTLPRHVMSRAWDAGLDGRTLLDRICGGAREHLTPDGTLLLVHSALAGVDATLARLAEAGMTGTVTDQVQIPLGPVLRARAGMLRSRGLLDLDATTEDLVVIRARPTATCAPERPRAAKRLAAGFPPPPSVSTMRSRPAATPAAITEPTSLSLSRWGQ